jgi:hypothetical protein
MGISYFPKLIEPNSQLAHYFFLFSPEQSPPSPVSAPPPAPGAARAESSPSPRQITNLSREFSSPTEKFQRNPIEIESQLN